jgi:hypothetical protein
MSNPELTGHPSSLDQHTRTALQMLPSSSPQRLSATRKMARGLGWFSLGLGLVELLASRPLARAIGLPQSAPLLQLCGVREIATGIGLLLAREPSTSLRWMQARVGGDALDLAGLAAGSALREGSGGGGRTLTAMVAVAGVTAVDLACTTTLQHEAHAATQTRDYGDRSGIGALEAARGAALATFTQPEDMRSSPKAARLNGAAASAGSTAAT